ncbi:MAG TPA: LacI family DNA-binding transcriptional regulator [Kineosporiaceae bacterium]|nr:LacI family DNA-binding transcriptional regulator [Kineosporiaceae bacterium]
MVTLGDVAARAGVSVSAVSRVLSNHPSARVSEATRCRILQAACELRYRPNFAGRALRSARTRVIGLVVPDLTDALFAELLHGAQDEARERDYMVLLGRSDNLSAGGEVVGRLVGEGRVDGMVVQVGDGVPPAGLGAILASAAPIVLLNSVYEGHVGSVVFDDVEGARLATEHLLRFGHTRIALANGLRRSYTARQRGIGFRSALAEAGLRPAGRAYETRLGYTAADGRGALRRLMNLPEPPTGVVVANVDAAIGLLAEARAAGVRVPRDLSVVSVHDSWTAENTWPPLTAVRMPFSAMGRAAVRAVIARIETGAMTAELVGDPAPELVVRESSTRSRR